MSKGGSKSSSGPPRAVIEGWQENLADARGVAENLRAQPITGAHGNHWLANQMLMQNAAGPGMQNVGNAASMAGNLGLAAAGGNYDPMMVQGVSAGPAALFGGAAGNRGDIRNVAGGTMPQQNMGDYMNPYTGQVIDRSLQDLDRARTMTMQGIGDQAAAAGAFGGSRHGVAEGEAHRGFADAASNMMAGLHHQGFDTASQLMQQDMNRGLQAGLANQGMDAQMAMLNPQLAQQAGLANMGALNQMGQFNAGQMQQANLANQAAQLSGMGLGLQGMNLGLTGANMMGNLGAQQFGMGQDAAMGLAGMGDFFRGIDQQRLDAQWMLPQIQQDIRNQAIGLGTGMNTSTSRERPDHFGQVIGAAGTAIGGIWSDRRLKENIVDLGAEPLTGLPWYEFSYLGDDRRFRGVMADDVERVYPDAVITSDTGYKVVDYGALGIDMVEVSR